MSRIFLFLSFTILFPIQGFSGLTENRVYPRLMRADTYIAQGKDAEAKQLLQEVVEIDSSNQKALKALVILCSKEKNESCVKKYSARITDKAFAQYYRADLLYNQKHYADALKAANSILQEMAQLNEQERFRVIVTGLKSAIFLHDTPVIEEYLKRLHPYWKERKRLSSFTDTVTLLIDEKLCDLGVSQIDFAHKNGLPLEDEKLINWAYACQVAQKYPQALHIVSFISNEKVKYDKEVILYSEMEAYAKAAKTMERLYRMEPIQSNRKRLLYLYDMAHMDRAKEKLYLATLQKKCIADDLRSLLELHKADNTQRYDLLESYAPFDCLDQTEQFNLTIELITHKAAQGKTAEAVSLLNGLAQKEELDRKELETISYWYAKLGHFTQAADIMEKLAKRYPSKEYEQRLKYLYAQAQMDSKIEALHLKNLEKGCERESLLYMLAHHPNFDTLKKYYPYSCLRSEEKFNYTLKLVHAYTVRREFKKADTILNRLSTQKSLTSKQYLAIADAYAKLGMQRKSRAYAQKAYSSDPKNLYAIKELAYSYDKSGQTKQAIAYYKKALAINPKETKLYLAIGSQYAKLKQPEKALYYWDKYRKTNNSPSLILLSAELALSIPDIPRAERYVNMLSRAPRHMEYRYFIVKSEIAKANNQPDAQRKYYEKAIAYASKNKEAHYAQLGYLYYNEKAYARAADAFEKSLARKEDLKYLEALGYTYQKLGENKKAINVFKKSIDIVNATPQPDLLHRYKLKQNVDYSKSFFGYLSFVSRLDDGIGTPTSVAIPQSSYNGFSMIELAYRPEVFKNYIYFYVRGLSGVREQNIALENQTWQPSVGVRYKPFEDQLLTLSIEHLFKGGDKSRSDTMIRASTGFFDDYHFHPVETEYWYKSLYLDAAYYIDDEIYSFYTSYEHGYVTKIGYETAIMPYVTMAASLHNDNYNRDQVKNVDIGIGVSFFFWLNEREYKPHQFTGRFSIEGRQSIYNNTEDDNTIRAKLELLF